MEVSGGGGGGMVTSKKKKKGKSKPSTLRPVMPFKEGFGKFQESGAFGDLILRCDGKDYLVHRLILAYSSEYFAGLLLSNFSERRQCMIELKLPDPAGVFPILLHFLYTGEVWLTDQNAVALLVLADSYLVKDLRKVCMEYISQNTTRENVGERLKQSIIYQCDEIAAKCLLLVAKNFSHKCLEGSMDYNCLPFELFHSLLTHKYLAVKSEFSLYKVVREWLRESPHSEGLSPTQVATLMEAIRFRWFSYEQLEEAVKDPTIPQHLIIEALMAQLYELKFPHLPKSPPDNPRLEERLSFGIEFEYQPGVEDNDILHWIGTNSGCEEWQNPVVSGRIKVTASSIEKGEPMHLMLKDPSELWTKDVPASWFQIDLGPNRAVVPTYYSLRHGGNYRADSLRTWDFQGSVDGHVWTLLRRHTNDESLNEQFARHAWPVVGQTKAYSMFRILQTGHNSSNHNFLVLSGVEIYGALYEFQGSIADINAHLQEMNENPNLS